MGAWVKVCAARATENKRWSDNASQHGQCMLESTIRLMPCSYEPKDKRKEDWKIRIEAVERSSTVSLFHERKIGSNQEHIVLKVSIVKNNPYIITDPSFLRSPVRFVSSQRLFKCRLLERLNIWQRVHFRILGFRRHIVKHLTTMEVVGDYLLSFCILSPLSVYLYHVVLLSPTKSVWRRSGWLTITKVDRRVLFGPFLISR